MHFTEQDLWSFLLIGYVVTVLIETPILCVGLSRRHSMIRRVVTALWLTACTYPIVVLVLPTLLYPTAGESAYVIVAEIFAPLAECLLFWLWVKQVEKDYRRREMCRDFAVIILANLCSFLTGEWLF